MFRKSRSCHLIVAATVVALISAPTAAGATQSGSTTLGGGSDAGIQAIETEPGNIRLSWDTFERIEYSLGLWKTDSAVQVDLTGWAPNSTLSIDYAWYVDGTYSGDSDSDVCYSTGSCTRHSVTHTQNHGSNRYAKVCVRVAVRQTNNRYYSSANKTICAGGVPAA